MRLGGRRGRLYAVGVAAGVVLWFLGVMSIFGAASVLSPLTLAIGTILLMLSAFNLLRPESGPSPEGILAFTLSFAIGLPALGFAVSGAFSPGLRLGCLIGGIALLYLGLFALRRGAAAREP